MVVVDKNHEDAAGMHGELFYKPFPVTFFGEINFPQFVSLILVPLLVLTAMAQLLHVIKRFKICLTTTKPPSLIGSQATAHHRHFIEYSAD